MCSVTCYQEYPMRPPGKPVFSIQMELFHWRDRNPVPPTQNFSSVWVISQVLIMAEKIIPDGQGYAAFGKVVKGMDIVRRIYDMPEEDQYFDPPVEIFNIVRL